MGDASGIGREGKPIQPSESTGPKELSGDVSGGSIQKALHTPVKTLGQLKKVLIDNLGEKEGTKLYNNFIKSFALMMLSQIREAAQGAAKAAQQMRSGPQG